ncbi:MAG: peptide-methionine (S)-S-oxide reductase MsrA [Pigmentiphaga sp.]
MNTQYETAVLGGGCFWCTEAVFQRLQGVVSVRPGYAGGPGDNPSYEQVCSGRSGHVEVIEVTFDPVRISFAQLLGVFFATHDPTTPDRQGNDVGPQYQSAIFCQSGEQRETARETIAELERNDVFGAPLVTRLYDAARFWPAEGYHYDYFNQHPSQGYCQFIIAPKVAKLRQSFAHLLAQP